MLFNYVGIQPDTNKYTKPPIEEEEEGDSNNKQDRSSDKPQTGETELERDGEEFDEEEKEYLSTLKDIIPKDKTLIRLKYPQNSSLSSPEKDTNEDEEEDEENKKIETKQPKKLKKDKGVKMQNAEPSSILYIESEDNIGRIFASKKTKNKKKSKKRVKM